jgi:hypothetical protein
VAVAGGCPIRKLQAVSHSGPVADAGDVNVARVTPSNANVANRADAVLNLAFIRLLNSDPAWVLSDAHARVRNLRRTEASNQSR